MCAFIRIFSDSFHLWMCGMIMQNTFEFTNKVILNLFNIIYRGFRPNLHPNIEDTNYFKLRLFLITVVLLVNLFYVKISVV